MTTKHLVSGFLLSAALISIFARPALAAGTCFCNLEAIGATETPGAADPAACQALCAQNAKSRGAMWATDPSQYPSSLLQCFSKKELCETDFDGDKVNDGAYDIKQPAECLPGWHYCYPVDTEKYSLQVSIPSASGSATTSVYNYGEYVGAMYKYLVGIAVTIAIVFMMVGGIRYVVGASTGEISKAKGMIVKAISGLVLLLFAYVILYTVNPELVKLQVPKLPMLRRVDLLTGDDTCESLVKQGYVVDSASASDGKYGGQFCGSIAAVTMKPDGTTVTGTTCMYSSCDNISEDGAKGTPQCVSDGKTGSCLTCNQVVPRNDYNVAPSAGICSALDPTDTFVNLVEANPPFDQYHFCGYTHSPSMVTSGLGVTAAAAATIATGGYAAAGYVPLVAADATTGTCAALDINCQEIATCEAYDNKQVYNTKTDQELDDLNYAWLGTPNLPTVCKDDPCQVGKKTGTTCTFVEGTAKSDCISYSGDYWGNPEDINVGN